MVSQLLSLVSRILRSKRSNLPCAICGKLVDIETAKTDDDGQAVHEECYFQKTKMKRIRDGFA